MAYRKRIADTLLGFKLETFGATLIIGPKACGKTTTAKQKAKTIIEFQDENLRDKYLSVANTMPSKLLEGETPILIDEWQDAPKIWGQVRKSVDDHGQVGLYILTGSSSIRVKTPHTGTGRISTLKMYPMSLFESGESNGKVSLKELFETKTLEFAQSDLSIDSLIFAICRGGWPASLEKKTDASKLAVARDLFEQICNKDISNIDNIKRNPLITEKILKSYSRVIASLASPKTIFDDVVSEYNIARSTYYEYIEALESLFIIDNIPAWSPAIRSRDVIRSATKKNLIDPSLAVAALGLDPKYFNKDFETLGFLFESLCIRDLKVYSSMLGGRVSYYRDKYGLEADAILHLSNGKYALIEFKLGANEIDKAAHHLLKLENLIKKYNDEHKAKLDLPELKIIITAGLFAYKREDNVFVVPIGCLKP